MPLIKLWLFATWCYIWWWWWWWWWWWCWWWCWWSRWRCHMFFFSAHFFSLATCLWSGSGCLPYDTWYHMSLIKLDLFLESHYIHKLNTQIMNIKLASERVWITSMKDIVAFTIQMSKSVIFGFTYIHQSPGSILIFEISDIRRGFLIKDYIFIDFSRLRRILTSIGCYISPWPMSRISDYIFSHFI